MISSLTRAVASLIFQISHVICCWYVGPRNTITEVRITAFTISRICNLAENLIVILLERVVSKRKYLHYRRASKKKSYYIAFNLQIVSQVFKYKYELRNNQFFQQTAISR